MIDTVKPSAGRPPRFLFAGGGTGGHVYPALAIADALKALLPDATFLFAGTRERMEWTAVPKAGYAIEAIPIKGFQRGSLVANLAFPYHVVRGMVESLRVVSRFKPDVVIGTGGYVSGPVLAAALLRGIPVVVQEQNAFAGVTNRLVGKKARQIHVAFEQVRNAFPPERVIVSDNPTRAQLLNATPDEARAYFGIHANAVTLLVFGGSLGSQRLNEVVADRVKTWLEAMPSMHLLWQTGPRYFERIQARVQGLDRITLLPWLDRMDLAYAAADLALCRSGAITCSELGVTGTPAVLVPSPNVAEDHQTHNARALERAGAAIVIPESDLEDELSEAMLSLLKDAPRRLSMGKAGRLKSNPNAAHVIAQHILSLL